MGPVAQRRRSVLCSATNVFLFAPVHCGVSPFCRPEGCQTRRPWPPSPGVCHPVAVWRSVCAGCRVGSSFWTTTLNLSYERLLLVGRQTLGSQNSACALLWRVAARMWLAVVWSSATMQHLKFHQQCSSRWPPPPSVHTCSHTHTTGTYAACRHSPANHHCHKRDCLSTVQNGTTTYRSAQVGQGR